MIVVDPKGNLFDERRKKNRRKYDEDVETDRRVEERRKDEWVEELNKDIKQEQMIQTKLWQGH